MELLKNNIILLPKDIINYILVIAGYHKLSLLDNLIEAKVYLIN